MPTLVAVAYVSSATRRFTPAELDELLLDARAFNSQAAVTGALLHHDGSFFQYFEGAPAGVEAAYSRIKSSRRHHGLIELLAAPIERRHFSTWSMGYAEPTASQLQAISQAQWHAERLAASHAQSAAPGMQLLLSFWQRVQPVAGSSA